MATLGLGGFTIVEAGENSSNGAFHQEKPHFAEAGKDKVIVKAL
jgi:hypothetical protein